MTRRLLKLVGYALMALSLWAFVWGVMHFGEPPRPGRVLSLQYGRTFGGLCGIWFGWMMTRIRPQD